MKIFLTFLMIPIAVLAENMKFVVVDGDEPMPWEEFDQAHWSEFAAQTNVNMDGHSITNAGHMSAQSISLGGETCSNWPDIVVGAMLSSNNLDDVSDKATARENLGLGTAATQNTTAFDPAGSASNVGAALAAHETDTGNPHQVTAAQVGALTTNGDGSHLTGIDAEQVGAISALGGDMAGTLNILSNMVISGTSYVSAVVLGGEIRTNWPASGDFMSDGSVPMIGSLDAGSNPIVNVSSLGFSGNSIIMGDGAYAENGIAIGNNAGGYMYGVAMGHSAVSYYSGAAVGNSANGSDCGAAIGNSADGSYYGAAVGHSAQGSSDGAAVGNSANGYNYGAAIGNSANGSYWGAAAGSSANGSEVGAAVGYSANGSGSGAALGFEAGGSDHGVGVGSQAMGSNYGVAVGANAYAISNSVAIGFGVTNTTPDTTRIRGSLDMSGGEVVNASAITLGGVRHTNWPASGDFMSDGSVPMIGSLDVGSNPIVNVSSLEFSGNSIIMGDGAYVDNGIAIGNNAVGDMYGVAMGHSAQGHYFGTVVGNSANGSYDGAAVGYYADGSDSGAAIGSSANGSYYGAAVGFYANGNMQGASLGYSANGSSYGAAMGFYANGSMEGAAVGYFANGSNSGAALGFEADGSDHGVGVGNQAVGSDYGVAVGANAYAISNSVAIGFGVTNTTPDTTRIRGSLDMSGGEVVNASAITLGGVRHTNWAFMNDALLQHANNTQNPHQVTATQVGAVSTNGGVIYGAIILAYPCGDIPMGAFTNYP